MRNEGGFASEITMANLLLEDVEYKTQVTNTGVWRRYAYIDGSSYHEFTSHIRIFGIPLLHYTCGKNPETARRVTARGIIAIGRFACGVIAIGHASFGLVAVGQLAIGIIIGLGQLSTGLAAVGQVAIAGYLGLGQFAASYAAIGQFGLGKYVLAQLGHGKFVWSTNRSDLEAIEFFKSLPVVRAFVG